MVSMALISEDEWGIAESCLKKAPNGTKIKKGTRLFRPGITTNEETLRYSFIKIEDFVYALGFRLGHGSYGKVKLLQLKTDEYYAVKITTKRNSTEVNTVKDLGMEIARPLLRLYSSKIYHVMVYLGSNFSLFLKQEYYRVNAAQLLDYSIQCVTQLDDFHQGKNSTSGKKRFHGDVKEKNFVILNGKITLIDFGFSREIKNEKTIIRGLKGGTHQYMAPEVFLGQPTLKSDIYSLGLVLHRINRKNNHIRHLAHLMQNKDDKLRPSLDVVKVFLSLQAELADKDIIQDFNTSFDLAKAIAIALQYSNSEVMSTLLIHDIKTRPFLATALITCSNYLETKKNEFFLSHGKEATVKLVKNLVRQPLLRTEAAIKKEVARYLAGKGDYATWYGGASNIKNKNSRFSYVYNGGLFGSKQVEFSSLSTTELRTYDLRVKAYLG